MEQLCAEQEGDLGGPRAVRMSMDDSDLADLAGGGLMSGHEILQLLQGMGESPRRPTGAICTIQHTHARAHTHVHSTHACTCGCYSVVHERKQRIESRPSPL